MDYVLIPGAGGDAWYWHLVERELSHRGHTAISVELPCDDQQAGLAAYTDSVVAAIADRPEVVLVAQSLGAFLVPLVHHHRPASSIVSAIILVNPMIPTPGESPGAWWGNTGQGLAMRSNDKRAGRDPDAEPDTGLDLATYFFHDVPADLTEQGLGKGKQQSDRPFGEICRFNSWPPVPTLVIAGRDDRFFPLEFQQRVARQRLGIEPEVVPGGHLVALSYPVELVDKIVSVRRNSSEVVASGDR